MNKLRQENRYKYYCTNDPATWVMNEETTQDDRQHFDSRRQGYGEGEWQRRGEARGRLGGGARGEGGGYDQRETDRGWEGRRELAKTGSNKEKSTGKERMEATGDRNEGDASGGNRGQSGDDERNAVAYRAYRKEMRGLMATTQTTLNDIWGEDGKNTRSWSEDIAERVREQDKGSQHSTLSYV
jgi:hypothetical protein